MMQDEEKAALLGSGIFDMVPVEFGPYQSLCALIKIQTKYRLFIMEVK